MTGKKKKREKLKPQEPSWVTAPAVNPLYRGATPAEVARALLLRRDPKTKDKNN